VFARLQRTTRWLVVRSAAGAVVLGHDQQFQAVVDNDSACADEMGSLERNGRALLQTADHHQVLVTGVVKGESGFSRYGNERYLGERHLEPHEPVPLGGPPSSDGPSA
jgi:hypothetical protein